MLSPRDRVTHPISLSVAIIAIILLFPSKSLSQTTSTPAPDTNAVQQELNKFPGLLPEFGRLIELLKDRVQLPEPRSSSDLLPLLPSSTELYVAFSNYGLAAHQALGIFDQELKDNKSLRDWWHQGDMATTGPLIEDSFQKFYELSQYLGDEVVVSGEMGPGKLGLGKTGSSETSSSEARSLTPHVLLLAQIRKAGLSEYLQKLIATYPAKPGPKIRVLDAAELAGAKDDPNKDDKLLVLVRPDYVIATSTLAELRRFNNLLPPPGGNTFASTPFGQRVLQGYAGGTAFLAAADLHTILNQFLTSTPASPGEAALEQSGFKDVKYLVLNQKKINRQSLSEAELSFTGPRHGAAAWLAAPTNLGSLDFVSPNAVLSATVNLKNLGDIFDDIKELSSRSNPQAFATLPQMEQAMHISLRDDLLAQFTGEITFELRDMVDKQPTWAAILRVNDAGRLQDTLNKLIATMLFRIPVIQTEEEGMVYRTVAIPSKEKPTQIVYAFVDGYMVVASSHATAAEAVRLHKSGESLAKSAKFLSAMPAGHSGQASGLIYEDAAAMTVLQMRSLSPNIAENISHADARTTPIVFTAYGEETAIRSVSTSATASPTAILVGAAIAIPNLLRARIAANESSAVSALRTINIAQSMYLNAFPKKGYARDLATFGSDAAGAPHSSADHAGYMDSTLGNAACTSGAWCTKSGYRFALTASCPSGMCKSYAATATPISAATGTRSFCSTSDAVIRFNTGAPLTAPLTASDCSKWPPLQQ